MRKFLLTTAALGGFLAFTGLAAQAAPMPHWSGADQAQPRAEFTQVDYYWHHHHWHHRHWHHDHWYYY